MATLEPPTQGVVPNLIDTKPNGALEQSPPQEPAVTFTDEDWKDTKDLDL